MNMEGKSSEILFFVSNKFFIDIILPQQGLHLLYFYTGKRKKIMGMCSYLQGIFDIL